jgi:hypothetical protein
MKMQQTVTRHVQRSTEHRFYIAFIVVIVVAVLLGFSRTFFLRWWFPEWAAAHSPHEPFFYFHGGLFTAWLLLLIGQASLVSGGRVDMHRRLGRLGAVLAVAMVAAGIVAALLAAGRPTGFIDVPIPPLPFLTIPFADMALFGAFVTLAIVKRRNAQSHKRFILLASIALLDAAIARWPFAILATELPLPGFSMTDIFVDLFLVPIVIWDLIYLRHVHRVTLWGGLALIASQPLRYMLAGTDAWLVFAQWAVGLFRA